MIRRRIPPSGTSGGGPSTVRSPTVGASSSPVSECAECARLKGRLDELTEALTRLAPAAIGHSTLPSPTAAAPNSQASGCAECARLTGRLNELTETLTKLALGARGLVPLQEMPDVALALLMKHCDDDACEDCKAACEELYRRHEKGVRGYVRVHSRTDEDTKNIGQETWLEIWRHRHAYNAALAPFRGFAIYCWADICVKRFYGDTNAALRRALAKVRSAEQALEDAVDRRDGKAVTDAHANLAKAREDLEKAGVPKGRKSGGPESGEPEDRSDAEATFQRLRDPQLRKTLEAVRLAKQALVEAEQDAMRTATLAEDRKADGRDLDAARSAVTDAKAKLESAWMQLESYVGVIVTRGEVPLPDEPNMAPEDALAPMAPLGRTMPTAEGELIRLEQAEWLLPKTFGGTSPPHQLIAFGFCKLLEWTPADIVKELSDIRLAELAQRLENEYIERPGLSRERLRPHFIPLHDRMKLPFEDAVTDDKTRGIYPQLPGRIVGKTTLRDYYTGTTESDWKANIVAWWWAVHRRVIAALSVSDDPIARELRNA